jgi:G:T-mismatch repair DNA endonuclease (very short patch repair protein)
MQGRHLGPENKQTMFRLERITQAGYQVKVRWECEFVISEDVEMEDSTPMRTRETLYGGRTKAMRSH